MPNRVSGQFAQPHTFWSESLLAAWGISKIWTVHTWNSSNWSKCSDGQVDLWLCCSQFVKLEMVWSGYIVIFFSYRLCVMLVLSLATFMGAYYISSSLGSVILSACLGYILSTDLGGLGSQILKFFYNRNKVSASMAELRAGSSHKRLFLWRWGVVEFLYHFVMLAVVGVISGTISRCCIKGNWFFPGGFFYHFKREYNFSDFQIAFLCAILHL